MMIDLCLLGCGGMMPLPDRWLSALLFRYKGRLILVDCGEGTQIPIKQAGWGFKSIDAICFTHFHADHIAGLPGLLLTIGNSGRTEPIQLFGPSRLTEVVHKLTVISPELPFSLLMNELPDEKECSFSIGEIQMISRPADHRIPCLSYSFILARPGRFDPARAAAAAIPMKLWKRLQQGETIMNPGGGIYAQEMVLGAPRKGIKIGFCTDTRPTEGMPAFFKECDLLICEGLYGDDALMKKAAERGHMTFSQAAALAYRSDCRELWLTHFSPALKDPWEYISNATRIFPNCIPGGNLMKKTLHFQDE